MNQEIDYELRTGFSRQWGFEDDGILSLILRRPRLIPPLTTAGNVAPGPRIAVCGACLDEQEFGCSPIYGPFVCLRCGASGNA